MSDPQAMENVVREIYSARDRGDIEGMMAHVDADCSFRIVGGPTLGPLSQKSCGSDSIRCVLQGLVDHWDMSNVDLVDVGVVGNTVFAHRAGRVRFIPEGVEFDTEVADKFVFRDGRVIEVVEFLDTLTMA